MKLNIFILTVLLSAFAGSATAVYVDVWSGDKGTKVGEIHRYIDGQLIPQGMGWLVELVVETGNGYFSEGAVIRSTVDGFSFGDGFLYDTIDAPNTWNGLTVRTVVYDDAVKSSATYAAKSSESKTFSWVMEPPQVTDGYDVGFITSDTTMTGEVGKWQAIPEPAVASFIAIFGGGLICIRRIFSRN